MIRASLNNQELKDILYKIEETLFVVGAELATIDKPPKRKMTDEDVTFLEEQIEYYKEHSDLINKFTIPGRSVLDGYFNILRTVTRRAERRIIAFEEITDTDVNPYLKKYVNRMSDLFYIISRLDFTKYDQ